MTTIPNFRQRLFTSLFAATLFTAATAHARNDASQASEFSLLPIGLLSEAPAALFAAGASLTVAAVQASADGGMVWVLERASDGARSSMTMARGAVSPVGTKLLVVAISTGWVLYTSGKAVAWTPNELGASLLHNERLSD